MKKTINKSKLRRFELDLSRNNEDPSPLASPKISMNERRRQRAIGNEQQQQQQQQQDDEEEHNDVEMLPTSVLRKSTFGSGSGDDRRQPQASATTTTAHRRTRSVEFKLHQPTLPHREQQFHDEEAPLLPPPPLPPATGVSSSNNNNNDDEEEPSLSSSLSDLENDDDKDGDGTQVGHASVILEAFEEGAQELLNNAQEAWEGFEERAHYDWHEFYKAAPKNDGFVKNTIRFLRWLVTGLSPGAKQTDDEIQENLNSLARLLSLLREYHERFGMPTQGGPKDQEYILRETTKDLYAGGAPIWALEPVMKKVAEGLTGRRGVDFFMLPRRTFIFAPTSGATMIVRTVRGYDMQTLDAMEKVAVKLASYASNTSSVKSMPSRLPNPSELREAYRAESLAGCYYTKEEMTEEILSLASEAEGLFFYINSRHEKAVKRGPFSHDGTPSPNNDGDGDFWTVEDDIKELFSRLAAIEAVREIDKIDIERKQLYSRWTITGFRFAASAGACAFWFNGSWFDILISGILAVIVAWIGSSPIMSKEERIIFEAVASLVVGLLTGFIVLTFPAYTCFGAIAISGVLDLLQGYRVVYSVIEIMSRHTVAGGADFLEGVFFTSLIAFFLRLGQMIAIEILGEPEDDGQCNNGINEWWYLLFVPLAAFAWSGLFNPHYIDLPFMAAHGVLGYVLSWQFDRTAPTKNVNNFLAAMAVTFSSGIISRFTGRQALGNTVAGLYVLLPGAYLVKEMYKTSVEDFLTAIILRAIIIGIGAWTGTILCSPTLLGTNGGFVEQSSGSPMISMLSESIDTGSSHGSMASFDSSGNVRRRRDKRFRKSGGGALLLF